MSKRSYEVESTRLEWTFNKMVIVLSLFIGGFGCIIIGLVPFIQNIAGAQDLANVGFMALIIFFMLGFFKVKKYSRFVFWAACFTLVLYTNVMFLFYESIFR